MAILAVFSMSFFIGALLALIGAVATADLLSGKSRVLARLIPPLRLLEQKKVRRTQKVAARRAGVIKMCLLAAFVIMVMVGVAVAIQQLQHKPSRFALAEVPDELKAEHKTVVAFLETLEAGRLNDAMQYCVSQPLFIYREGSNSAHKEGDGIRDSKTNVILEAANLTAIRDISLANPDSGPLVVELFDGRKLIWKYRVDRKPGDGAAGDDPIQLFRIEAPPVPTSRPLIPPGEGTPGVEPEQS